MKLDRNGINGGKYAVLNMRRVRQEMELERSYSGGSNPVHLAIQILENHGLINYGEAGTASEFFVIMLKDEHACMALTGYAANVTNDREYQNEILDLSLRAGPNSLFCKAPD